MYKYCTVVSQFSNIQLHLQYSIYVIRLLYYRMYKQCTVVSQFSNIQLHFLDIYVFQTNFVQFMTSIHRQHILKHLRDHDLEVKQALFSDFHILVETRVEFYDANLTKFQSPHRFQFMEFQKIYSNTTGFCVSLIIQSDSQFG